MTMALRTDATVAHAPDAHAASLAARLAQRTGAIRVLAREAPRTAAVGEAIGCAFEDRQRVEREVEHVALEEQLAAAAQLAMQHVDELLVHQAPLLMAPLEPRVGEVDEHAGERAVGH